VSETPPLVLYQFAFSHYNEKVRWTLDHKGLPSQRRSLLPGLHERTLRRLSGGPTTTPLLQDGDRTICGSAAIVAHLEARAPSPALFPSDAEARREAEDWVARLDERVGPAVRLALFHELLQDPDYAARMFATGQSALKGGLYRRLFPRLVPMLRRRMAIDDETAAAARATIETELNRVDEASRASGYLVGDRFSVADLTAGSLFFPLFFPPQISFDLPQRSSQALESWRERWRGHAGADYVRGLWDRHR
jgi:glutathione S-transferase